MVVTHTPAVVTFSLYGLRFTFFPVVRLTLLRYGFPHPTLDPSPFTALFAPALGWLQLRPAGGFTTFVGFYLQLPVLQYSLRYVTPLCYVWTLLLRCLGSGCCPPCPWPLLRSPHTLRLLFYILLVTVCDLNTTVPGLITRLPRTVYLRVTDLLVKLLRVRVYG